MKIDELNKEIVKNNAKSYGMIEIINKYKENIDHNTDLMKHNLELQNNAKEKIENQKKLIETKTHEIDIDQND